MEHLAHNDTPLDAAPTTPTPEPQKKDSFFGETLRFVLLALIIVAPIRIFIAQPFIVSGASMEDTFENGEYIIVDQISYRFEEPARGDIVIFRYPKDPSKFFIKRVIGLPGETVRIADGSVTIVNDTHPDGMMLDEPYIRPMHIAAPMTTTLGKDQYFVMGDNRDASSDSRIWGTLPRENIVGRAYLRLFPLSQFSILPGEFDPADAK